MVSISGVTAVVCFLDRDYRYKSVSTPHDAGLTPIPYTGRKCIRHLRSYQSSTSKAYALNSMTRGSGSFVNELYEIYYKVGVMLMNLFRTGRTF